MYSEKTTITGFFIDSDSDQLCLSIPAADLYDAAKSSEVLLSWQSIDGDDNVVTKYSRLVSTSRSPLDVTEDVQYTFVFDNGETYFNDGNVYAERTSGDTDVPADPQTGGGGSGGGALVVNVTDGDGGTFVADKSMSEVLSAIASDNPVLCKYNTLISFFTKDEDYPEVYASVSTIAQVIDGQGHDGLSVRMYYFEYAEDGTFSGSKSEAIISI